MTSPQTPAADRPLDARRAAAAVDECFPDRAPGPLRLLGAGWDHDVYRSHDGWLWRFPRRRKIARLLPEEIRVVAFAHQTLAGSGLAVPLYERFGRPTAHFPYPFVGTREVPGVALDALPRERLDREALARALGAGLGALHVADPASTGGLDIRRELGGAGERLAELAAVAPLLDPALPDDLRATCRPWLAGDVALPPEYPGPPRVIHADMCPDHVIVDPQRGRVTGVIDFADLSLGDPVLDYVGLAGFLGDGPIAEAWRCHPLRFGPADGERLRFLARVASLRWLADAIEYEGDVEKHLRWVRTSFGTAPLPGDA